MNPLLLLLPLPLPLLLHTPIRPLYNKQRQYPLTLTSGRPELVTAVVLYRRGNVWLCRTGIVQVFVTPVSTADCRRSVVALVPGIEFNDVVSLTITLRLSGYNVTARQKRVHYRSF